jgi:hypothetical protein
MHVLVPRNGLEQAAAQIGEMIRTEPAQAAALYQAFLADCFASRSRSTTPAAASACLPPACSVARPSRGRRRTRIPGRRRPACWHGWDDDPYEFCLGMEKDLASVLDEAGLARAGAADAGTVGRGRPVGGARHSLPLPAVATGRHRRGFRLSGTGYPVRRRADRVQRPSRPVRRPHHAALPGQGNRRDSRLPLPAHGSSRRIPGQTPSHTPASASPTRAAAPRKLRRNRRDHPVCAVTQPVLAESRPRRLEAQPLLNHKRAVLRLPHVHPLAMVTGR